MKTQTYYWDASMEPFFNEAREKISKNERISMTGISWKKEGNFCTVEIIGAQREDIMIQFGIEIGRLFERSEANKQFNTQINK